MLLISHYTTAQQPEGETLAHDSDTLDRRGKNKSKIIHRLSHTESLVRIFLLLWGFGARPSSCLMVWHQNVVATKVFLQVWQPHIWTLGVLVTDTNCLSSQDGGSSAKLCCTPGPAALKLHTNPPPPSMLSLSLSLSLSVFFLWWYTASEKIFNQVSSNQI